MIHVETRSESYDKSNDLAAEVRSVLQAAGVEGEVLPTCDRIVVHLPLADADRFSGVFGRFVGANIPLMRRSREPELADLY